MSKRRHSHRHPAPGSKPSLFKAIPWTLLLQAAFIVRRRWGKLSAKERSRLSYLVVESRGWPGNLNSKQRKDLGRLLVKLDLRGIVRDVAALARHHRRRHRRHRRGRHRGRACC